MLAKYFRRRDDIRLIVEGRTQIIVVDVPDRRIEPSQAAKLLDIAEAALRW